MRAASLNAVNLPALELQPGETCLRHYCAIIALLTIFNAVTLIFQLCYLLTF